MNKKIAAAVAATLVTSLGASASFAAPVLEPEARAFVDAVEKAPPLYTLPFDDARKVLATVQSPVIASSPTTIQDAVWSIGPTGKVRVRIVRPEGASGALPVVMYFHGGGWVMGDKLTHDHLIRELAAGSKSAVVFVDYDNAPAVRYPTNNEQAYAALEYVAKNGASLSLDGSRIAVAGDSAGGNMAASVTLMAKERKGPRIAHQVLFYPVTADISDNESYQLFGNGPYLTTKAMHYFLDANFPADRRGEVLAFPLQASVEQLRNLPSGTIIVAENDLLRAEGEAYGRKLLEAGVSVNSSRYNGTIHDFVMLNALAGSRAAKAAIVQASTALHGALHH